MGMSYACNCMYGPQDRRCCINRAQEQALKTLLEAHVYDNLYSICKCGQIVYSQDDWAAHVVEERFGSHNSGAQISPINLLK
jgi:hypothetical protein